MAEERGSGCLKAFLLILFVVALIVVGGGVWVYFNTDKIGQFALDQGSKMSEMAIEQMLRDGKYSEDEVARIMVPVKGFGQEIRDGKLSIEEGLGVLNKIVEGPVFAMISLNSFYTAFVLPSSELSPEQKVEAQKDINRYLYGVSVGTITFEKTGEVFEVIQEDVGDASGETKKRNKENLSPEEIRKVLAIVKQSADEAGIENKDFSLDLAKEIEKAIVKGKAEPIDPESFKAKHTKPSEN